MGGGSLGFLWEGWGPVWGPGALWRAYARGLGNLRIALFCLSVCVYLHLIYSRVAILAQATKAFSFPPALPLKGVWWVLGVGRLAFPRPRR